MAATETIRIRIDPEVKNSLTHMYARRGTTISQAVRTFLYEELENERTALDRFDAIMTAADAKMESAGEPEVSIDDIVTYIDSVRDERRAGSLTQAG